MTDQCIETTFARSADGYGVRTVWRFGKKINRHHVLAWVEAHGRLPGEGMEIMHTCDNPACINVDHLVEGTHAENMRDMAAKGRSSGQKKTHCPAGHAYDDENTRIYRGFRHCRACDRVRRRLERKAVA